ncbi:hypothetical protein ACE6H2_023873 [Prunus campanulata]
MDKVEKETQDFMNVESFSQLPFIRPAPPVNKEKGIRLFGIEFGADTPTEDSESLDYTNACEDTPAKEYNINTTTATNSNNKTSESGGESSRRFECHYCCRNFPTSQALGGHQNAHKRERQHAKREHLQSAMVHAGHHGLSHDAHHHVYGLMNYTTSRLGASPHHHHTAYPSWNSSHSSSIAGAHQHTRFYGSSGGTYGTQSAPINGSPLALWRIPAVQGTTNPSFNRDRSMNLFAGGEEMKAAGVGGTGGQGRYVYDSSMASVQDHTGGVMREVDFDSVYHTAAHTHTQKKDDDQVIRFDDSVLFSAASKYAERK